MKHISQRRKMDCGVAVVAMLCGSSYSKIDKAYPGLGKHGLHVFLAQAVLTLHTRCHWPIDRPHNMRLHGHVVPRPYSVIEAAVVQGIGCLLVRDPDAETGTPSHWIILHGTVVHDPALRGPVSVYRYAKRNHLIHARLTMGHKLVS